MKLRLLSVTLLLAGCAALPHGEATGADVLLIGEQHDAAAHPGLQRHWVDQLARRGTLHALVLEMAERGTGTEGLPPTASEAQVRQALRWNEAGWPWERQGPAIMAAVRAGIPVVGGNLPRTAMREAMEDPGIDALLPAPALQAQQEAIRRGHCDMLPAAQIGPMTRVQVARDLAMAQALAALARPGGTVVLIAGAGHVEPRLGVPVHLPRHLRTRPLVLPPEETGKDYCAEFRRQMQRR